MRRTRKFKSTRRKQHGGIRYEELEPVITEEEHARLNDDDKYYYEKSIIYKKIIKAVGNTRKTFARLRKERNIAEKTRRNAEKARRLAEIRRNDYEGTITEEEFAGLERGQQAGWKRVPTGSYPGNNSITYERKTPENIRRERESSVEWQIAHNPRVELSESQYRALTPEQKALGWVEFRKEMGMSGYGGYMTYYRRRTDENIRRERESSVEWQIAHNPRVELSESQYHTLNPEQKSLGWVKFSNYNGIPGYGMPVTYYRRRTNENIRREEEQRYRESLEGRIALPYGQITNAEYATLSPSEKTKWHKRRIRTGSRDFINAYVKKADYP